MKLSTFLLYTSNNCLHTFWGLDPRLLTAEFRPLVFNNKCPIFWLNKTCPNISEINVGLTFLRFLHTVHKIYILVWVVYIFIFQPHEKHTKDPVFFLFLLQKLVYNLKFIYPLCGTGHVYPMLTQEYVCFAKRKN